MLATGLVLDSVMLWLRRRLIPGTTRRRDTASRQQRGLERAGDRLLALAGANGVTDDSDTLPRLGQSLEALGRSAAGPVVEPVADSRRREQPGDAGPARGALVEHADCDRTETEAVGGAGRDHQAVERREQLRSIGRVALEAEFDALADAGGDEVGDIALEAVLARRDLLEQRGFAGIAKRAARARILLEHRHLVSIGDQ